MSSVDGMMRQLCGRRAVAMFGGATLAISSVLMALLVLQTAPDFGEAPLGLMPIEHLAGIATTRIRGAKSVVFRNDKFQTETLSIPLEYAAPAEFTKKGGRIDLIPVVRYTNGSKTTGVMDSTATGGMSQLTELAAYGSTTLAVSFLVSGKPGTYTLIIYMKPSGGSWEDRFRKIDGSAHVFSIVRGNPPSHTLGHKLMLAWGRLTGRTREALEDTAVSKIRGASHRVLINKKKKSEMLDIPVQYAAPVDFEGEIDLVPVIRFTDATSTDSVYDSSSTGRFSTLQNLPASGHTTVKLVFLHTAKPGKYVVVVYMKPAGAAWEDRFMQIDATYHVFEMVAVDVLPEDDEMDKETIEAAL